ncbi:2-dehydro-3-deoxygalactonokinase [Marinomonas algicola]|uniref:2-dehydro-3-deoxygalactonokinase n=1 Tax=Marinomonas algicola TaxID=2773454 RepID=UPI00174B2695|nr:2-dehydro-3-deoxygalactonokinase [Marinomonas algicola]
MDLSENSRPLFIAIDWGTTNLRAFLVDKNGNIQAQKQNESGMLSLNSDEFENVLKTLLEDWLRPDLPVYMAGMVGSRGGWQEVPYQSCPIALSSLADHLQWLTTKLPCPVAIVPGIQGLGIHGYHDVIRGEETQLLGALDWLASQGREGEDPLCCMPGTHCKWVQIEDGGIQQFSTTLSGEIFARLNDDSSLVKGLPSSDVFHTDAFNKGVATSLTMGGFLHHLFSTRSRVVCGELTAEEGRDYLSGVVIGTDVKDILSALQPSQKSVLLIGSHNLSERYALALAAHGLRSEFLDASDASIRGLKYMAANHQHSLPLTGVAN